MGMVFCRGCGKEIHESAPTCPHCGAPQGAGSNSVSEIPPGVKGWSWGAFLLNWIWAIGNRTWIGLLAIIPYVGVVMAIVLGFKGREWAWKARKWESVEQFNLVQKKWSFWGVMLVLLIFVFGILAAIAIPAYRDYQHRAEETKQAELEHRTQESEKQMARQPVQEQPSEAVPNSPVSWSSEFKTNTYNSCANRAKEKEDTEGIVLCECVIEKASTIIPEERMVMMQTDPEVQTTFQSIVASCKQ